MDADQHRPGPRAAQPPPGASVLRAYLRLPAPQARVLLPTADEDDAPLEGGILGVLLSAALRRARELDDGDAQAQLALPRRNAHSVLLRVPLARVRAAGRVQFAITCEQEMDWLLFNSLHRSRRVASLPSRVYLLRLLLRLPAHQARRLLPPPAEATRTRRGPRSAFPAPSIVTLLLYAGLRRLQAAIPPGSDGLLRDFVQVVRPLSHGLLPPPTEGDHAVFLLPPPPPLLPVQRRGLLNATLYLIRRALPERPLHRDREEEVEDDDVVVLLLRVALHRISTGPRVAG